MGVSPVRRVMVLGLDGATWTLLRRFAADGTMPRLASFLRKGCSADLITQMPPVTATAWSSFVTGLNPGKHGVFEFLLRKKGLVEEAMSAHNPFGEVPVNSALRDGIPVWDLVGEAGLKSVIKGVPITYPPRKIEGCMLSGFLTPFGRRDFAEPPEILDEIEARFGPYRLYHRQVYSRRGVPDVLDELHGVLDYDLKVTRYLMERIDWSLLISHFWGTDRASHELWHLLDENHPRHDRREAAKYGPRLKAFYSALDEGLGSMVEDAGGASVIIASDHGFGPIHTYLSFNMWLVNEGFIKLKGGPVTSVKRAAYAAGLTPTLLYRLSMAMGLAKYRLSGGFHSRQKMQMLIHRFFLSLADVDWKTTRAYSRGNYGQIYVNLKGREPWGSVEPGAAYEAVRREVRDRLLEAGDPATGENLFERVYFREEVYEGPYVDEAPDIVFVPRDMSYKALGTLDFTSNNFMDPVYGNSGDHRMNGIFLGLGPGFAASGEIGALSILDITPTVLYLLGLSIPRAMDGRVAEAALDGAYLAQNAPRYVDKEVLGRIGAGSMSREDRDDIKRRLEGIGYIG
jgi:predicted AlkP superfamily phosphohydrolase/phosphomutase